MRLQGIDFLRGIAVLAVIFRHSSLDCLLQKAGWAGVDLFFVLSGFLVSGLLFREYKKSKTINFKKFLIRRGFKIYPAFYSFLLFYLIFSYIYLHKTYDLNAIMSELFFVQSYFPNIFSHTWSLAIEEQFYFGLCIFVYILIICKKLENVKLFITILVIILASIFINRFYVVSVHNNKNFFPFVSTHLRLDGIIIGTLISYLYHFTNFNAFFKLYINIFVCVACILISPIFMSKAGGYFMNSYGLLMINIGFGIIVLLAIQKTKFSAIINIKGFSYLYSMISYIGLYSYSIYLWHIFVEENISKFGLHQYITFCLYLGLSILLGIVITTIIEKPLLNIREKYFKPDFN